MAKITVDFDDSLSLKLSQMETGVDQIIPEVLEAGGVVMLAQAKSNLALSIGQTKYPSRATGELVSKLGMSPAKLNREGDWDIKIGFAEPHSGGVSSAMLANTIEHGKHGQPARPFMKKAASSTKNAAIAAMKARFDTLTGGET